MKVIKENLMYLPINLYCIKSKKKVIVQRNQLYILKLIIKKLNMYRSV